MAVPPLLYKYRSLTGPNRKFTERAITKSEIYFPRCSEFNDPFDCRLNVRGLPVNGRQEMERVTESVGIFCLSARNDSLLMWSHYTDGHRGICLQFSTGQGQLFGCTLEQVIYQDLHPELAITDTNDLHWTRRYLTTKALDWSYEQEWRIFYDTPGPQVAPHEEMSAVILGCSISPSDRQEVVEWVRTRPRPTLLYQAQREDGAFRLRFSPIEA